MGARGANIQKVCSDFNVQIKIPDRKSNKAQQNGTVDEAVLETNGHDNNSDIIRISGRTENVKNAAAALKALVPINIEVRIPLCPAALAQTRRHENGDYFCINCFIHFSG